MAKAYLIIGGVNPKKDKFLKSTKQVAIDRTGLMYQTHQVEIKI